MHHVFEGHGALGGLGGGEGSGEEEGGDEFIHGFLEGEVYNGWSIEEESRSFDSLRCASFAQDDGLEQEPG